MAEFLYKGERWQYGIRNGMRIEYEPPGVCGDR